jgi:aminoglycoside 6'-N-acetyltransferase I
MAEVTIRTAAGGDFDALLALRRQLWDDSTAEELRALLEGPIAVGGLPGTILVAEAAGAPAGFAEVSIRSYADGCDSGRPVGYLEGWFVDAAHRRKGIGAKLIAAAEDWARAHGCDEFASDTWIENDGSHRAHLALGFEEVDRCIHYRKRLR